MQTAIMLRYTGPAVQSGRMDVYEASANMIAFSDFLVLTAKSTFGESIDTRAEVSGFAQGSFITELVFNLAGVTGTLFASVSPDQLWEVLKEAFNLWKHLKGSPPTKIENSGNYANVTNNNGDVIQVTIQTLNVVFSEKGSESAGRFVRTALEKPGMDSVEIQSENKKFAVQRVTQAESVYFVPVASATTITDVVVRMGLVIEAPVFKEGNKWRFFDGQQPFYADIQDGEFLAKVNAGEPFRKGDVLYADVRISQQQSGMKISAERIIVKVHEHKIAPTQTSL